MVKIPATLATNQQAVLENLREGQRRQENLNNLLIGGMMLRQPIQQQQEHGGVGALPPNAPVIAFGRGDFYPPRTHNPNRIQLRRRVFNRVRPIVQNAAQVHEQARRWIQQTEPAHIEYDEAVYG